MSVGGYMNLENILSDLVKCFYFSDPIGGDIEYKRNTDKSECGEYFWSIVRVLSTSFF